MGFAVVMVGRMYLKAAQMPPMAGRTLLMVDQSLLRVGRKLVESVGQTLVVAIFDLMPVELAVRMRRLLWRKDLR